MGKGSLDVVMAVDGRSDTGNDALANALVLGHGVDGLDVILGHGVSSSLLIIPNNVVGDDHCGKDREPILGVQARVVAVAVDSSQLNFVTGSNLIAEVPKEKSILGPWQPASSHLARRFLQCDPLVVLVQRLHLVDLERSETLAFGTGSRLGLLLLILVERSKNVAALGAVELDHEELRQDATAAGDNATGPDKLVEVKLPQTPQFFDKGQLADSHLDICGNSLVVRVDAQNNLLGSFVENFKHLTRRLRKKVCKSLTLRCKDVVI